VSYPTTITAEPGLPFIDIVREFEAPAEAVFRAHIDPNLYVQWLGPRSMKLEDVVLDATTGGRWKYVIRGEGDMEISFFGVFHTRCIRPWSRATRQWRAVWSTASKRATTASTNSSPAEPWPWPPVSATSPRRAPRRA
jgi:uncharacterized protein YndB with AHSA1/START domain